MDKEGDKIRSEAFSRLGLEESFMKSERKAELVKYIETMSLEDLVK